MLFCVRLLDGKGQQILRYWTAVTHTTWKLTKVLYTGFLLFLNDTNQGARKKLGFF